MTVTLRRRAFEILEVGRPNDPASRVADIALISLISLNILAVILESLPSMADDWKPFFGPFETFSVIVFTVEYLLRFWSTVEERQKEFRHPIKGRIRFMLTPMAIIDLMAILPFYLVFFVDFDLRFLRVLRLLRVFKLTRYSSSMTMLLQVLKEEARSIGAAFFVLMLLVVMSASLLYLAEQEAQPEAFGSIPAAMWWAIITMTTVGYGDVTPITGMGKTLGAVISIISVGMVALPAGLLASGFTEAIRRRRDEYEKLVDRALEDGMLETHEIEQLETSRESLGLSQEDAVNIMGKGMGKSRDKRMAAVKARGAEACPHCGKPLK